MLNVNYNERLGWIKAIDFVGDEHRYDICGCNALAAIMEFYTDEKDGADYVNLISFFADEEHLKRLLGLSKGDKENHIEHWGFREIHLSLDWKFTPKFVQLLAKSKTHTTIELY